MKLIKRAPPARKCPQYRKSKYQEFIQEAIDNPSEWQCLVTIEDVNTKNVMTAIRRTTRKMGIQQFFEFENHGEAGIYFRYCPDRYKVGRLPNDKT